jgi:hypothetical protein
MDKKRLLVTAAVIIGLGVLAYLLAKKDEKKSMGIDLSDRDFSIENLEDIGRISLKSKIYPELVFTRNGESWLINGKYPVNDLTFPNFLATLTRLQMVYLPPKESMPRIVEDTKTNGIRIKIYDRQNQMLKDYYIGAETADDRGTFYLMEGSNTPYVMGIIGFEGSIRNRMLYNMDGWRSKNVFSENPDSIKFVEIEYLYDPQNSFAIRREKNRFVLDRIGVLTKFEPIALNNSVAEAYLSQFRKLDSEANDNDNPNRDLIRSHEEFAHIRIGYMNGKIKSLHLIAKEEIEFDKTTKKYSDIDVDDRFFIKYSNNDLQLIKFTAMNKILVPFNYFYGRVEG